jgi:AcrR family transcriptional regulator
MSEASLKMADDRRERVLRAAERSFIASGFHGARMAQIAKEAQMSPGHIYHYFESKEQIIAEMIRAHFEEKMTTLERYREAGDRVVDLMIENLNNSIATNTDPFWSTLMLEIAAEATRNAEIASALRSMDADMKSRVTGYLRNGVNQDDLDTRLEIFVALLQGLGMRNIINPNLDKGAVVRIAREIVELLFRRPG